MERVGLILIILLKMKLEAVRLKEDYLIQEVKDSLV